MSEPRAKRGGGRLANPNCGEVDSDGSDDGGGGGNGFAKASADVLAKRKIVSASRKKLGGAAKAPDAAAASSSNPFGGFTGLTGGNDAPAKPNPFAVFSGLSGAPAAVPCMPFSTGFGSATAPPAPGGFTFGGSASKAPAPSLAPAAAFPAAAPLTAAPPSAANHAASLPAGSSSSSTPEQRLRRLNAEFGKWVAHQAAHKPDAIWRGGVADYVKFAAGLVSQISDAKTGGISTTKAGAPPSASKAFESTATSPPAAKPAAPAFPPPKATSGFTFGAPVAAADGAGSEKQTAPAFSFGAPPAAADSGGEKKAASGFSFGAPVAAADGAGSEKKTAPAFSFGAPAAPAAASGGFTFGAAASSSSSPKAAAKPFAAAPAGGGSFGGFTFGSGAPGAAPGVAAPAAAGSAASVGATEGGGGGDVDDDDEDVPPEVVEVVEKAKDELDRETVFECRGKLSRLGDERDTEGKRTGKQEWKEMGTGHFQVLHGKGADYKRYLLMRDEKLGKLKLNTLVVKGMQFSRAGKASINFSTQLMEAPTDPETGKVTDHDKLVPKSVMLNLRLPKDRLDEGLEKLLAAVPK